MKKKPQMNTDKNGLHKTTALLENSEVGFDGLVGLF